MINAGKYKDLESLMEKTSHTVDNGAYTISISNKMACILQLKIAILTA